MTKRIRTIAAGAVLALAASGTIAASAAVPAAAAPHAHIQVVAAPRSWYHG